MLRVDLRDPHRVAEAQATVLDLAIAELASGHKRPYWVWFALPYVMADPYAIRSELEPHAYLDHPMLRANLQCRSSMTLVEAAGEACCGDVLDRGPGTIRSWPWPLGGAMQVARSDPVCAIHRRSGPVREQHREREAVGALEEWGRKLV